jgi:predicted nucleic acid-binding protein
LKAVANSSVLIALTTIGQLMLLTQRFSEGVLVPQAVWREVVETGKGQAADLEVNPSLYRAIDGSEFRTLVWTRPNLSDEHEMIEDGGIKS